MVKNNRIQHKHETEENWSKASFIPIAGEIVIYDADEIGNPFPRIKIGDGITEINNLPFFEYNLPVTNKDNDKYLRVKKGKWVVDDGDIIEASNYFEDCENYNDEKVLYKVKNINGDNKILWAKKNNADGILFEDSDGGQMTLYPGVYWTEEGVKMTNSSKFTSKNNTPTSDYEVSFQFKFEGEQEDTDASERDEGLYILPLNDSNNPNIKFETGVNRYKKYKIRLSKRDGIEIIYDSNSNANYGCVASQWFDFSNQNTLYKVDITKLKDTLIVNVEGSETQEPVTLSYTAADGTITAEDLHGFEWHYTDKQLPAAAGENIVEENVIISNMHFKAIQKENYSFNNFIWENVGGIESVENGYQILGPNTSYPSLHSKQGHYFYGKDNYSISFDFSFSSNSTNSYDGIYLLPCSSDSSSGHNSDSEEYRIRIAPTGINLLYRNGTSGNNGLVSSIYNTPFEANTTHTILLQKNNDNFLINIDNASENFSYTDSKISEKDISGWQFVLYTYLYSSTNATITNLKVNGISIYPFWNDCLKNQDNSQELFDLSGGIWSDYTIVEEEIDTEAINKLIEDATGALREELLGDVSEDYNTFKEIVELINSKEDTNTTYTMLVESSSENQADLILQDSDSGDGLLVASFKGDNATNISVDNNSIITISSTGVDHSEEIEEIKNQIQQTVKFVIWED